MSSPGGHAPAVRAAADRVVGLVGRTEVRDRWAAPSALTGMSVGGLAQHLAAQVGYVRAALTDPDYTGAGRPVTLREHYARSAWVRAGVDDAPNVTIREGAERAAADGCDAVLGRLRADAAALDPWPERTPAVVRLPWWHWTMAPEDFLVTRMMEMVVHADDLAVSVGLPTPQFPDPVVGPVLGLLADLAGQRHGRTAVVRALSRAERAPGSVSAF